MMSRPRITGRTPLSPDLIRSSHALKYSESDWAMTEGGSSATAASSSTVRSAPASMRSAFRGAFATGAAQSSCRHVLDHALAVERRSLVLNHEPAEVQDGDP